MIKLFVAIIALVLGGCCTTIPEPLPCPSRPVLESFTFEEITQMGPEIQEKVIINNIRLKAYAKQLEARADCEI